MEHTQFLNLKAEAKQAAKLLVAKFMGWTPSKHHKPEHGYLWRKDFGTQHESYLKYDQSWDALKPVIDKIGEYTLAYPDESRKVTGCRVIIDIKYMYAEVVFFLMFLEERGELLNSKTVA